MGSWFDGLMGSWKWEVRSSKWQVKGAMRVNSLADGQLEVGGEKCDLRLQLGLPIVWWLGHPPLREPSQFLFWERNRLADAKLEVAGEKCDFRQ